MDVADFFQFECTLKRRREVVVAAEIQKVGRIRILRSNLFHLLMAV